MCGGQTRQGVGRGGGARSLSGPLQITAVSLSIAYQLNSFISNTVQLLATFLLTSVLPFHFYTTV